jgi:hypothetical protein
MQNDAEPGQLTRSEHIENLEFTPDEEENEEPDMFVSLNHFYVTNPVIFRAICIKKR